jgi:PIN domain nuclease of toxin-antitoxin system
VKLLLDTCALLWLVDAREQLSDAAIEALSAEDAQLFVSAISAFEIAVKVRKGKLALTQPPRDWFKAAVLAHRLVEAPISSSIAAYACEVPLTHGDPADRMIVATAMLEGLSVVTSDRLILACPGLSVIW